MLSIEGFFVGYCLFVNCFILRVTEQDDVGFARRLNLYEIYIFIVIIHCTLLKCSPVKHCKKFKLN